MFTAVHNFVHLNLAIALFIGYLVFAVGVELANHEKVQCTTYYVSSFSITFISTYKEIKYVYTTIRVNHYQTMLGGLASSCIIYQQESLC